MFQITSDEFSDSSWFLVASTSSWEKESYWVRGLIHRIPRVSFQVQRCLFFNLEQIRGEMVDVLEGD